MIFGLFEQKPKIVLEETPGLPISAPKQAAFADVVGRVAKVIAQFVYSTTKAVTDFTKDAGAAVADLFEQAR